MARCSRSHSPSYHNDTYLYELDSHGRLSHRSVDSYCVDCKCRGCLRNVQVLKGTRRTSIRTRIHEQNNHRYGRPRRNRGVRQVSWEKYIQENPHKLGPHGTQERGKDSPGKGADNHPALTVPQPGQQIGHKFHAVATDHDGIRFDSKLEAAYYDHLCLLKKAGDVLFFCARYPYTSRAVLY